MTAARAIPHDDECYRCGRVGPVCCVNEETLVRWCRICCAAHNVPMAPPAPAPPMARGTGGSRTTQPIDVEAFRARRP